MYGLLDVSASGLVANRTRLTVSTANLANRDSIVGADGEYNPYRRRFAVLAPGDPVSGNADGVHVSSIEIDEGPLRKKYEPWSRFADADGYVGYPDIDPTAETVNAMEAMRAYEANVMAAEATKSMMSMALRLLG
ncbi:MAG: flagellar basal body rod protein FlgC [Phycisphaerales bacterium]